jgi:hypothetical protein
MEDWFSFVWIYSKDAYTLTKNPYKSLFLFGKCMQPKPWKLKLLPPFIGLMRSTDFFFYSTSCITSTAVWTFYVWHMILHWKLQCQFHYEPIFNGTSRSLWRFSVSQDIAAVEFLLADADTWLLHLEYWNYLHACVSCQMPTVPHRSTSTYTWSAENTYEDTGDIDAFANCRLAKHITKL